MEKSFSSTGPRSATIESPQSTDLSDQAAPQSQSHELGAPSVVDDGFRTAEPITFSGPSSGPEAQPDLLDGNGRRFVWIRKIPADFDTYKLPPIARGLLSAEDVERQTQTSHKTVQTLTIEELAAKLRPVLLRGGNEYILDHDPIEMAVQIREHEDDNSTTLGYKPDKIPYSNELPLVRNAPPRGGAVPEFVIGADERVSYDHSAISWPAMTAVLFPNLTCSGTIIGTRSVASAAHCFNGQFGPASNVQLAIAYASDTAFPAPLPDLSTTFDYAFAANCTGSADYATVTWNITHTHPGDLSVALVTETGTPYLLSNRVSRPSGTYQESATIWLGSTPKNSFGS